jgi:hypothetical protein
MEHKLKTLPKYFESVLIGSKKFEIRKDDRDFQVGDTLLLLEFDRLFYTSRKCKRKIVYILRNATSFGLKKGYVILGIQ